MVENDEVIVTLTESHDTPNLYVWEGNTLIAKIWLYPDGSITYRSFYPKPTPEIHLGAKHFKEVYEPKQNL